MIQIMNKLFLISFIICFISCGTGTDEQNKRQKTRDNVVNAKELTYNIDCDEVLIGSIARPYIFGKYLMIVDYKSIDKLIHVFDKKNFKWLYSFGDMGQGPNEISSIGTIAWNNDTHEIYVMDNAQRKLLSYNADSLSVNHQHLPSLKLKLSGTTIPDDLYYINDTLSYGSFVKLTESSFLQTAGKWNMDNGNIDFIDYVHPADKKKRIAFSVSTKHDRIVECSRRYDLMSLYDTDLKLLCNIYGPNWDEDGDRKEHFSNVAICGDKIVASYIGEDWQRNDGAKQLHIFTIDGDYIKTLYLDRKINRLCYDEDNNRLIINFDSDIQFGYLNLNQFL